MKTKNLRLITAFLLLLCAVMLGSGCEKDEESDKQSVSITLHDKSLSIIQNYTTGNWELQYAYGGLSAHKVTDLHNSYMNLTPEHIIMGNDLYGIVVDTTVIWVREKTGFSDSTYLLSYTRSGYSSPEYYIVDQIKDDTLIIADYNISDGFYYYYTKN
jgi:hypothetical protein